MNQFIKTAFGWAASGAIACLAAPVLAHEPKQVIMPEDAEARTFNEQYGFSDAVVHGDTVYLAGVMIYREEDESEADAYVRGWEAISVVLEKAGSSLDDILDISSFHTDLMGQAVVFTEVKNRYIKAPYPTWTAIDIDRIFLDNGIVEIKIVARLKSSD
jgi:enamine deaminase RidA (YjgF/YER057c/UK114 family)